MNDIINILAEKNAEQLAINTYEVSWKKVSKMNKKFSTVLCNTGQILSNYLKVYEGNINHRIKYVRYIKQQQQRQSQLYSFTITVQSILPQSRWPDIFRICQTLITFFRDQERHDPESTDEKANVLNQYRNFLFHHI